MLSPTCSPVGVAHVTCGSSRVTERGSATNSSRARLMASAVRLLLPDGNNASTHKTPATKRRLTQDARAPTARASPSARARRNASAVGTTRARVRHSHAQLRLARASPSARAHSNASAVGTTRARMRHNHAQLRPRTRPLRHARTATRARWAQRERGSGTVTPSCARARVPFGTRAQQRERSRHNASAGAAQSRPAAPRARVPLATRAQQHEHSRHNASAVTAHLRPAAHAHDSPTTEPSARPNTDIRNGITTWNDNPQPCIRARTADEILDSVANYYRRITDSRH